MDEYRTKEEEIGAGTAVARLRELVRGIRVAMMVTVDNAGRLHSRPMATLEVDDDGSVWFLTAASAVKVEEVHQDGRVHLTYARPTMDRYVAVTGRAETVDDRSRIRTLWSPVYRAWFPKGPEDPDLTLVRVRVEEIEAWDRPGGAVGAVVGAIRAIAGGRGAEEPRGHTRYLIPQADTPPQRPTPASDVRPVVERAAARVAEVVAPPSVSTQKPRQPRAKAQQSAVTPKDAAAVTSEPGVTRPARATTPKAAKKGRAKGR